MGDMNLKSPSELVLSSHSPQEKTTLDIRHSTGDAPSRPSNEQPLPIPITVSPATPDEPPRRFSAEQAISEKDEDADSLIQVKRSNSIDRDTSKSKKVQKMLKTGVHKGQARISNISRKIGNGVVRTGSLRRINSTPGQLSALCRQRWCLALTACFQISTQSYAITHIKPRRYTRGSALLRLYGRTTPLRVNLRLRLLRLLCHPSSR
jgi:hypothetical protein